MAQLIRSQNKKEQISVEQIIKKREDLVVPEVAIYRSIEYDSKAPNFLTQERHRHVFETQTRTQQRFLETKFGEFGIDKALKTRINSKFDNKERLAAPLLSPTSYLKKYKKFDGI
jgi:hypothetical protein